MADFFDWIVYWLYNDPIGQAVYLLGKIVVILIPLLLAVAYLTYAERKVIAAMQLRKGPNVVGPFGLLQPIADAVKLLFKETILPSGANRVVFLMAPMLTFVLAMIGWAVIPFDAGLVLADINVGILYLFAISSLGVYGVIMAGWASNSKYPFLGALRSAAQMVSYEVSMGFVIITVLLLVGSLNLSDIVLAQKGGYGLFSWFWLPMLPMFVIFFISTLAETNRSPFDLPEGESELRRVLGDDLRPVLPGRVREHDPHERDDLDPLPRRLAATDRHRALQLDPGPDLAVRQDRPGAVLLPLGPRDLPALPLRPAHAPRLEGVPPVLAVLGGAHRGRAGRFRHGAEHMTAGV